MKEILKSVFAGGSIDMETFEKRLAERGEYRLIGENEYAELEEKSSVSEELENELKSVRDESKIELSLSLSRAKNIKAARAVLDTESVYDENGLSDELLKSQIETMKRENPWLFDAESTVAVVSTGRPHGHGMKTDTSRMSDEEYYNKFIK